jgi:cardiolipin synthase
VDGSCFAELLVDGHRILPRLLDDIARAQRSVHVAMFLFFRDPIGDEVADALIAAHRRGVRVRVLLNLEKTEMGDPFSTGEKEMMKHDPNIHHDPCDVEPLCRRMRAAGVAVVDTNIDYEREPHVQDPRLRSIAAQIREAVAVSALHVDHRKLVIIDGAIAYCGGANVGAQYMYHHAFDPAKDARSEGEELKKAGHPEPWWKWHDSLTRFEGPIAREIDEQFHARWCLDGGDEYRLEGEWTTREPSGDGHRVRHVEIHMNEPDARPNGVRELYVKLISEARRSIFIENPYFYHPAVAGALVRAKENRPEVEIDLVLPARTHNDNSFAHDAQQYWYARWIDHGIRVYEYQNHFNHLKMAVFDERFSIHGSTNLNYRSLEDDKDFELVILVDDEPFAREVLTTVRDVDVTRAKRFEQKDLRGLSGRLRVQTRDPRTLFLLSRRVL